MKKVAIYLISDGLGGAEQVVWQTIKSFGLNSSVFLIVNNEIVSYYSDLLPPKRIFNIGDIYLHSKKKFRIIRFLLNNRFYSCIPLIIRIKSKKIKDYLVNNDISIIHSHLDYALYSSLLIKKLKPNLIVFHTVHSAFGLLEDKLLKPSLPLSWINFTAVNKLIFVSNYNYNLFKESGITINDYEIIYNGIDFIDNGHYSGRIKINKEFEILYVGGSKYVKGYDILVETIDLLCRSDLKNNFKVIVLGHLPENCDFMTRIKQRGLEQYFQVVGFITPPLHLNYFQSSDILFMPSRSEAMPIAAIEAISMDLPIVANSVGGLPEIVKHGDNGFLGNNNPHEYTDFLIDLFTNYDKYLDKAKNYNQLQKHQFSATNMCRRLHEIY